MGSWYLQAVSGSYANYDTPELYGSEFKVTLLMSYKPIPGQPFTEPPKLDWHEKFIMVEHTKGERWVFEANMHAHNPTSNTLKIWPRRYIEAYIKAGNGRSDTKGSCTLLSTMQQPVPLEQLQAANTDTARADAVRAYLNRMGGYLDIVIVDIPSMNKRTTANNEWKERLLLFDCGVVGGGNRLKAAQYLSVDLNKLPTTWTRRCERGWFQTDLPLPRGYTDVPAPLSVSAPRQGVFMPGEAG